jgi:hypothetical protein
MSSIIRRGDTFHGISVVDRGVFTHEHAVIALATYAGQHRDGYACGLGVLTLPSWGTVAGDTTFAEHGPDGQYDGRQLVRSVSGITWYRMYERGERKDSAVVKADGHCWYNDAACAPDDPRLLALIAQVAPVEVRPAARAPHPPSPCHSPPSNRPRDQPAGFLHTQALAAAVATEVHPHAASRRWRRCWWPRDTHPATVALHRTTTG